ncbi:MAG: carboxymuconolactone decarboxylase family protein [Proteobacteria bacterium]|nr:carboxymuconolactone decarboxylase family protein [Pseudomonadota bacterium]
MFKYHTKETAPQESQELLDQSLQGYGFVPNFHKIMAEAPATYKMYNDTVHLFMSKTSFSKLEAQVVFMTANFQNNCQYCMAGHSWGMTLAHMPDDVIQALREDTPIPDAKLQELRSFTKEMLISNGHVDEDRIQEFLDAGYTRKHILELVGGLAAKMISNMVNALAETELDEDMQPYEWTRPDQR